MKRTALRTIAAGLFVAVSSISFVDAARGGRRSDVRRQPIATQNQNYDAIRDEITAVYKVLAAIPQSKMNDEAFCLMCDKIIDGMINSVTVRRGVEKTFDDKGYIELYAKVVDEELAAFLAQNDFVLEKAINMVIVRNLTNTNKEVTSLIRDELKTYGIKSIAVAEGSSKFKKAAKIAGVALLIAGAGYATYAAIKPEVARNHWDVVSNACKNGANWFLPREVGDQKTKWFSFDPQEDAPENLEVRERE